MNKILDIIIPVYNARETLSRTLFSIGMQTIIDKINIIIVDDNSDCDYSDIIENFSKFFDITYFKLSENSGPGVARQFGIDHSDSIYFTFIDADDTYVNSFTLELLIKYLEKDEKFIAIVSSFMEEIGNLTFTLHKNDLTWLFGKIYKRSFIEEKNIRFTNTRANEDAGFNSLIKLCTDSKHLINYVSEVTYIWHFQPNSLVRKNEGEYFYKGSLPGYIENMINTIKRAKENNAEEAAVRVFMVNTLIYLYYSFFEIKNMYSKNQLENFHLIKAFYNETFEEEVTEKLIDYLYQKDYEDSNREEAHQRLDINLTFKEFLIALEKGEYNE